MFSRLDKIPACDGQTDGHTDRHRTNRHRTTAKTAICRALRLHIYDKSTLTNDVRVVKSQRKGAKA